VPRTKINSQNMKVMNERLILSAIIENGPLSRVELSKMTKLTPSTISRIVSSLQNRGFVEESERVQMNQVGRKATKILATKEFCLSIIFNVGVEKTEVAVGYLDNSIEKTEEFPTQEPTLFFKRVKETISKMKKHYNLLTDRTFLVFAFPGIVNVNKAKIIYIPNLNWENIDLKRALNEPYRILADNEANLSILAESVFSQDVKESDNAFFLYVSQGIGGGAMIDHKVLRGKNFSAAEVGHTVVESKSTKKCQEKNRGCWEAYASIKVPVNEYEKKYGVLEGKTYLDKFASLIELYKHGDRKAKGALKEFILYLSIGTLNIVNTFNPDIFIFGGSCSYLWELFGNDIYEELKKRAMPFSIDNVIFRDTIFKDVHPPIVGANVLATKETVNTL
jgi:glucokinase